MTKRLKIFSLLKKPTRLCYKKPLLTIHFIHVFEPRNPGDMCCMPYLYFKEFFNDYRVQIHTLKDVQFSAIHAQDIVILGGGGIFECLDDFQWTINRLLDVCDNVIAWSCGHNNHKDRCMRFDIDYSKFKLLSVRDFDYDNQRYVPDVSCFIPDLTKEYPIKRRIGILEHQDFPINLSGEKINHKLGKTAVLDFIGSSEIIVTNTWHGAYWAMLMNKKVVLYEPYSNKFDNFKYPLVVYSGDLELDIANSVSYPDFIQECRELNLGFLEDVKKIIKSVRG